MNIWEFIDKHPIITIILIFMICATLIEITKYIAKGKDKDE